MTAVGLPQLVHRHAPKIPNPGCSEKMPPRALCPRSDQATAGRPGDPSPLAGRGRWALLAALGVLALGCGDEGGRPPIIDMHLHPMPWGPDEVRETSDFTAGWRVTMAAMDRLGIVRAVASGTTDAIEHWRRLSPDRIIAGILFPCDRGIAANGGRQCFADGDSLPDLDWLRAEIVAGRIGVLGEITTQYLGLEPDHPMMLPYYALAEELDVPIAIHLGDGPPGAAYPNGPCGAEPCSARYRAGAGDPLGLESLLLRFPRLRVFVMHAGWPMLDRMLAILFQHPQVYVDVAILGHAAIMPRASFHHHLCRLVESGFGDRIMYGTDAGAAGFEESIEAIETAPCLSAEQRRDIFHDNAARFLRLADAPESDQ
ncbi:MAG: amidohydrolase family protein [Gemmatimonadales bacterium]